MSSGPYAEQRAANLFSAAGVSSILRERGWLPGTARADMDAWMAEAAALLGPHAEQRADLERFLGLVFQYDAGAILASP
jgi:hypothetical protein